MDCADQENTIVTSPEEDGTLIRKNPKNQNKQTRLKNMIDN